MFVHKKTPCIGVKHGRLKQYRRPALGEQLRARVRGDQRRTRRLRAGRLSQLRRMPPKRDKKEKAKKSDDPMAVIQNDLTILAENLCGNQSVRDFSRVCI